MTEIRKYIESGVLEEYCLGILPEAEQARLIEMSQRHPEVKEELSAVELAFEKLALTAAVEPAERIRKNLLDLLGPGKSSATLDTDNLPLISGRGDPEPWMNAFPQLIPDETPDEFQFNIIRQDDIVQQMIVSGNADVAEEEHSDFYEGLFILKGRCECTIGGAVHILGPGDFVEMPLHTGHDVKLLTPFVTAVLQYRFV
ncbi:MAG TPA: cupin domain-containing protein [Mucilaginibacter sp.]|nr:cupin domain-containing protein [Mucilaginibacter sp.]